MDIRPAHQLTRQQQAEAERLSEPLAVEHRLETMAVAEGSEQPEHGLEMARGAEQAECGADHGESGN
jgi:hypothetical protein